MGAIKRLGKYEKGVVSPLYICFKTFNSQQDNFFEQYFDGGFLNREIHKIAQEGARNHGLLNVSVVEFFKDILLLSPSLPEQQKIADFLSTVDDKTQKLTQKKDALTQYKKGLLQKLFPSSKKGGFDTPSSTALSHRASTSARSLSDRDSDCIEGNIPELRFSGFSTSTGSATEWVEKRLGEVATMFSGGTPTSTNKKYYSGNIPFIGSGKIGSDFVDQYISEEALESSSAKLITKGDLLYALYGATSGEVAISKIDGAINQAVLCIRTKENIYFLSSWLRMKKESITKTYLQGGQGNLSASIVKKLKLHLPSLPEQQKIADFLTEVDNKITQVDQQIEKTTQFKKGLLQQMFV